MRMYYIFDVKDEIMELYKDNPSSLFKILNSIYYMHREDLNYGFNLFKQLTNKIDTIKLNRELYIKYHKELIYTRNNNEHIINNLYEDEISILKVNKSHLLLQSNNNYSSFFNILNEYNYFVCDFLSKDFFFIDELHKKTLL